MVNNSNIPDCIGLTKGEEWIIFFIPIDIDEMNSHTFPFRKSRDQLWVTKDAEKDRSDVTKKDE